LRAVPDLRASDADRERVIGVLRRHHEDGRITSEELDERIGTVWATKYASGLAEVTADLPDLDRRPQPPPPAAAAARALPRWPGRRGFAVRWRAPATPVETMVEILGDVAPPLNSAGYALTERHGERVVFVNRRIPGWVALPVVLLFPFGLFALLIRTEDRITIELVPQPDGSTLIYAGGIAPLPVRRAFAQLEA
jgi:Domain of unknown function (DUF1707)